MDAFAWATWLTVAAGAALLLWALYFDRSRGRRRCPKCWYDLGEVKERRCPECGRTAKHEGLLYLTRRRLGWAATGLAVIASAWIVNKIPAIREHGPVVITPTWYMAWRFPHYESPPAINGGTGTELMSRIGRPETPDWVRRLLIRRAIATANDPGATPEDLDRAFWWIMDSEDPNGGTLYRGFPNNERPTYADRVAAMHTDRQDTIEGIVAGIRHEDGSVKSRALAAAGSLYSSMGAPKPEGHGFLPGHPVLIGSLAHDDAAMRSQAASVIGALIINERSQGLWELAHGGALEEPMPSEIAEYDSFFNKPEAFAERVIRDIDHEDWRIAVLAMHAAVELDGDNAVIALDAMLPLLSPEPSERSDRAWESVLALIAATNTSRARETVIRACIERTKRQQDPDLALRLIARLPERIPDELIDVTIGTLVARRDAGDTSFRPSFVERWASQLLALETLTPEQAERVRRELTQEDDTDD